MLFSSLRFLFLFLPLALFGYFALGRISRWGAALWLAASSVVFYACWNVYYVPLLLGSIAFNYLIGLAMTTSAARPARQGWLLAFGVTVNLLVLGYYKYLAWLLALGHSAGLPEIGFGGSPVLPLGISFFTFTQIGYLVDCRQNVAQLRRPVDYALFVTFFPHLIAGPILHSQEIMPQFAEASTYRFNRENFAVGLTIFVLGLAKKVLIADKLGPFADAGFQHPEGLLFFSSWGTALAYSLQLYFDFSGYSDMAIGLARLFNVRFPLNFYSPYKARSIIEFWLHWHMTLTRLVTLYVYNPIALSVTRRRAAKGLGISKRATATAGGFLGMIAFPVFVTMTLLGIWHGAGAQFLVFGLLHAAYITINHLWRTFRPPHPAAGGTPLGAARAAAQVLLTFAAVTVSFVFFRAPSVPAALAVLAGMIGLHGAEAGPVLPAGGIAGLAGWAALQEAALIAGCLAVAWAAPNVYQIMDRFSPALARIEPRPSRWPHWRPNLGWASVVAVLAAAAAFGTSKHAVFLYFNF